MKTKCMSCGGSMKKMQKGGAIKKKPLLRAPKSKTGMDALKALGKYASTFGFATEGYNPAPSKKAKKTTPKMAVGGTTTKRIIKKSTGGMYGIPQENLGTSGQYGFAKKGGATKKYQKGGYTVTNSDGSPYSPPANQQGFKESEKKYGPALSIEDLIKDSKNQDRLNKKRTAAGAAGFFIFKKQNKPVYTTEPKMKKGGATKATKFAALAPPYDKATFADRIVGAKKSAGSKKLPKAQLGGILKMAIRATKPLAKTLKPIAKKIVSKSKTTATKKFNYPKDKVKSMFPRVADDIKKYNSETNPQKLFERKTIKEQMKQWDKAAELKQQKKYPVLKNKN